MARNEAAAPSHVCPGIRIHAIDIVQPPGIGIPPIVDIDAHQTIVTATLVAKSSAEMARKARSDVRSETTHREIPLAARSLIDALTLFLPSLQYAFWSQTPH